jgi:gentisate 1,2-dioxygenase
VVMSSRGFRHLASRAPATIQAGRAQYVTNPPVAEGESPVQAHVFADPAGRAFDPAEKTGLIELDRGEQLGVDYPATTANLLARYLVLREGDEFEFDAKASSVLFYAMKGSGRSFQEDEVIEWAQGDVFLLPGGVTILNEAPDGDSVLFVVTDEPLLAALGCTTLPFDEVQVLSTHYAARTIAAKFEDMASQAGESATQANLRFTSSQFEERGCVAPAIGAGFATLEAGAGQSPHCHDVDTISLGIECASVHAMIEGNQTDWVANAAMLTPAGAVHSQHNGGENRMVSFYVQDVGPRNVRTWEPHASREVELEGLEIPV